MDVCAAIVCAVANLGRTSTSSPLRRASKPKNNWSFFALRDARRLKDTCLAGRAPSRNLSLTTGSDWAPSERDVALTARDIMLVRASFSLIVPIQDTVASLFYDRLFVIAPELRPLFRDDLGRQKRKLMNLLTTCIGRLHDFSALAPGIRKLGARHVGYGVKPQHYATIGETLLWTLAHSLGAAFEPELRSAWVKVYELLAKTMQAGAGVTERGEALRSLHRASCNRRVRRDEVIRNRQENSGNGYHER